VGSSFHRGSPVSDNPLPGRKTESYSQAPDSQPEITRSINWFNLQPARLEAERWAQAEIFNA